MFISKLVLMFWQIAMDASVCSLYVPNTYVNVTVDFCLYGSYMLFCNVLYYIVLLVQQYESCIIY